MRDHMLTAWMLPSQKKEPICMHFYICNVQGNKSLLRMQGLPVCNLSDDAVLQHPSESWEIRCPPEAYKL